MLFAESMELPPPRPITKSQPCSRASARLHGHGGAPVGQDLVEQRVPDALLVQHGDEAIQIAVRAHGFSGGDDDERFLARQGRRGEIVEAAGAEQDLGGNGIREFHMILPDEWTVRKRTVDEV